MEEISRKRDKFKIGVQFMHAIKSILHLNILIISSLSKKQLCIFPFNFVFLSRLSFSRDSNSLLQQKLNH